MPPSLLGRRDAFRPETEDVDFDFIALSYMETTCPSPRRTMTLQRLPRHDRNTLAIQFDSRRLRQVAQSAVGCLDKSILMPDPVLFRKLCHITRCDPLNYRSSGALAPRVPLEAHVRPSSPYSVQTTLCLLLHAKGPFPLALLQRPLEVGCRENLSQAA